MLEIYVVYGTKFMADKLQALQAALPFDGFFLAKNLFSLFFTFFAILRLRIMNRLADSWSVYDDDAFQGILGIA